VSKIQGDDEHEVVTELKCTLEATPILNLKKAYRLEVDDAVYRLGPDLEGRAEMRVWSETDDAPHCTVKLGGQTLSDIHGDTSVAVRAYRSGEIEADSLPALVQLAMLLDRLIKAARK